VTPLLRAWQLTRDIFALSNDPVISDKGFEAMRAIEVAMMSREQNP
jgi:hypothetical protein